jgi:hypothetical protein
MNHDAKRERAKFDVRLSRRLFYVTTTVTIRILKRPKRAKFEVIRPATLTITTPWILGRDLVAALPSIPDPPTVVPKYPMKIQIMPHLYDEKCGRSHYMSADVEDPVRPDFVQYQQRSSRIVEFYAPHGVLCVRAEIIL